MSTTDTAALPRTALTGDYQLDPSHSRIGFQARHAMVTKVRGAFNEFEGTLHLDAANPAASTARVVIQAASIDTRNADRDGHLKSSDFLALEEHPTITFASTAAREIDADNFELTGDLTIRGVTRPVTIPFELTGSVIDPWGNTRVGFEGGVVINRKDWGVNWNAALEAGGILVGEKVTLEFELSAVKVA
jgi:polyisoprenoid-binding protein YceI